eukprot:12764629-Alexandrium_andersonii.AAC.1
MGWAGGTGCSGSWPSRSGDGGALAGARCAAGTYCSCRPRGGGWWVSPQPPSRPSVPPPSSPRGGAGDLPGRPCGGS